MPRSSSDIRREGHGSSTLDLHPYFGRVDPGIARFLIDKYSDEEDLVLDPFCGSGTVIHVAATTGRSVEAWDSSPLAILISTAKVIGLHATEATKLKRLAVCLEAYGQKYGLVRKPLPAVPPAPDMPRVKDVSYWFRPSALRELAYVKHVIDNADLPTASRVLARVALSRIVTRSSQQQGESSYRRVERLQPDGSVIDGFVEALVAVADAATGFYAEVWAPDRRSLLKRGEGYEVRCRNVLVRSKTRDSRHRPSWKVNADLVVSSPPYLMSWDYGLYHKFRFYWLGFDLDGYEETEIGRHLRRKNDDVARYLKDMRRAWMAVDAAMAPDSRVALINAPSIVHGQEVDTNRLLEEAAQAAGWELESYFRSLDIPGPHHGMHASLRSRGAKSTGKPGKQEHILVFRRAKR